MRADFLAGLTVALVLIPQSMAYAELAGLPAWVGLYASFVPVVVAALWGSSRHLQTGPVAMTSLLTATALIPMAVPGTPEYLRLACQMALVVGAIRLVMALARLTFVVNFISRPVVEGFLHAGVLIIAFSQFGRITGIEMPQTGFFLGDLAAVVRDLPEVRGPTILVGLACLALLYALERRPWIPGGLIAVAVSTLAVWLLGLSDPERVAVPVAIVGRLPRGLPPFTWTPPDLGTASRLLPGAVVITFIGLMEMYSVAKAVAARSRQLIDLRQETAGQGLAALAAGMSGGYPVSGSLSRTALNYSSGARTGLSAVFTGVFVLVFLLFFTRLLYYLPKPALAAIIIKAVLGLIDVRKFRFFWKVHWSHALVAGATFAATLLMAPRMERGIALGIVLSLVAYLYRTMQPRVVLLGKRTDGELREAGRYGLPVDADAPVVRFDGRLYFANTSFFEEKLLEVASLYPRARHIAACFGGVNDIDATGAEMLQDLSDRLRVSGTSLVLFDIRKQVYEVLERSGLVAHLGREHVLRTLSEVENHTAAGE